MKIMLTKGDITEYHADVIVNAANSSLMGGGGVDGAIHQKGGPAILQACKFIRGMPEYRLGLRAGLAVATVAGDLPAKWVIHTVGPRWSDTIDRSAMLTSCYTESLRIADLIGATSVAFPAISAGIYGWPAEEAARVALLAVRQAATRVGRVSFVLSSQDMLDQFRAAAVWAKRHSERIPS